MIPSRCLFQTVPSRCLRETALTIMGQTWVHDQSIINSSVGPNRLKPITLHCCHWRRGVKINKDLEKWVIHKPALSTIFNVRIQNSEEGLTSSCRSSWSTCQSSGTLVGHSSSSHGVTQWALSPWSQSNYNNGSLAGEMYFDFMRLPIILVSVCK